MKVHAPDPDGKSVCGSGVIVGQPSDVTCEACKRRLAFVRRIATR